MIDLLGWILSSYIRRPKRTNIIFTALVIFYCVLASEWLVLNFTVTKVSPFSEFFTFLNWEVHTAQCRKGHHNLPEFSKPVISSVTFGCSCPRSEGSGDPVLFHILSRLGCHAVQTLLTILLELVCLLPANL